MFQNNKQLFTTSDYEKSGFVFAPYDTAGITALIRPDEMCWADFDSPKKLSKSFLQPEASETEKNKHLQIIARAIRQIKTGALKKVVLSRKIAVAAVTKPLSIFQEILCLYPRAFCYLWYHPEVGMWAGASPETFLNTSNNVLTTMSLAGTQRASNNMPPKWGSKEVDEQGLVTSYILEALKNKIRDIKVSEVDAVRAGNLWHLKTTISGDMSTTSLKTIIRALHPTPAVCGHPLKEAQLFVSQNESYQREYYTGFLGELNMGDKKETQLFVNLRCLQFLGNTAILYVGGGITTDSVPENEWQETLDKAGIMGQALFNSQD